MKPFTFLACGLLPASLWAGEAAASLTAPAPTVSFCDSLKTIGTLYQGDGPINKISIDGRLHWTSASVHGDADGDDFSADYHELRRLRLGLKVKFLDDFTLVARPNLEKGGANDHDLGYNSMESFYLDYRAGDVGFAEDLLLRAGRQKYKFTYESHTSSNNLKTVERSQLTNTFYASTANTPFPVGLSATFKTGKNKHTLALYSTDGDPELSDLNAGTALYYSLKAPVANGQLLTDLIYNDASASDEDLFGYEWAISSAYTAPVGNWNLMVNGVYSEGHGNEYGYGLVVMPTTWIIEDSLEFVARYEYNKSNTDFFKNSRYLKKEAGGQFSKRHSLYTGVNYYFCNKASQLLLGAEYEDAENEADETTRALTIWTGYRFHF